MEGVEILRVLMQSPIRIQLLKELRGGAATVEQPANTSSVRSTVDQINPSVGTSSKWDLIPYVVTKSLLCGVLAESELRIDSVFFPGVGTSYTDYDFNAQDYDATCKDEWYVPGPFNTVLMAIR